MSADVERGRVRDHGQTDLNSLTGSPSKMAKRRHGILHELFTWESFAANNTE